MVKEVYTTAVYHCLPTSLLGKVQNVLLLFFLAAALADFGIAGTRTLFR